MGRKSKARSSSLNSNSGSNSSIREMMRGLKNRWGRFQCPKDGSICKSLEAWLWHRHKYHQTEHINYVELEPDEEDHHPTTPQSTAPSFSHPMHPSSTHPIHPSSTRLLPPEAFAPRRQPEVVFPDDASDLTEPDMPVLLLLSEEVTSNEKSAPEVDRWETMDEEAGSVVDDEEERSGRHDNVTMATAGSRSPQPPEVTCDAADASRRLHDDSCHGDHQESSATRRSRQSPARETDANRHGNGSHSNGSHSNGSHSNCSHGNGCHVNQHQHRDSSQERRTRPIVPPPSHRPTSLCPTPTTPTSLSSAMDLVAVHVLRLLQRDGSARPAKPQDILREVEASYTGLGLSRDALEGVVAGALMGARDQWKNGYNAGWKDGAREVLSAPLLRSPLYSPGGVATPNACAQNPGEVKLLTLGRRRSLNEKKDGTLVCRNSIENLETSGGEQTSECSTRCHDNDLNNNDADTMT